jgi:hypothetical protein
LTTTLTCPNGHRFKIPRVIYGYPLPETFEAAQRGEVTIGGCMPDLPVERTCPTCGLPASSDAQPTWQARVSRVPEKDRLGEPLQLLGPSRPGGKDRPLRSVCPPGVRTVAISAAEHDLADALFAVVIALCH